MQALSSKTPERITSQTLTRVGKGTPMGQFMREYWIPALMSRELEPDGDPVRLLLLGEKLIAFRDSDGKPGVMDQRCPHRGVSLFLGRNEEGGIRCIYHGWKFTTDGQCVEMPNVPAANDCKHLMRARAYPTQERAGMVWVYMGERAEPPGLPDIEATRLADEDVSVICMQRQCNYLQMIESDLDTSHFAFLHLGSIAPDDLAEDSPLRCQVETRAPEFAPSSDMPWGTSYGAHFNSGEGRRYWRVANYLMPFWTQTPQGDFRDHIDAVAYIPMDDEHTMMFRFSWRKKSRSFHPFDKNGDLLAGLTGDWAKMLLPNTTDWYGRWRPIANASNDWKIDRAAQRADEIFSGVTEVLTQDQAAVESMGPIVDHSLEHFVSSDQMALRTRRRMVKALRRFVEDGAPPPGVDDPTVFAAARSGFFEADESVQWPRVYKEMSKDLTHA
jgi:phthalate 4,5-dioxygenase oxygenase subunit